MVAAATDVLGLESAKAYLNITVTKHDDELTEFLAAAVAEVEKFRDEVLVDRLVQQDALARGEVLLTDLPVQQVVSVVGLDPPVRSWSVLQLHVTGSGVLRAIAGAPLQGLLRITYQAGMTSVPANYSQAVKLVLAESWRTQRPAQPGARNAQMASSGGNNTGPTPLRRIVEDVLGTPVPGIA